MSVEAINKLINLKEKEVVEIAVTRPIIEDNELSVEIFRDREFGDFAYEDLPCILSLSTKVSCLFNEEIKKDVENYKHNDLLKVQVTSSNEGFKVNLESYYLKKYKNDIRDDDFRKDIYRLTKSINRIKRKIEKNINGVISCYFELKEAGEIKEFIFLYKNGKYISKNDFVVCTDRPIHQQKEEVQKLIDSGLTERVYDKAIKGNPELIGKKIAVSFTLVNDNEVGDIRVSTF